MNTLSNIKYNKICKFYMTNECKFQACKYNHYDTICKEFWNSKCNNNICNLDHILNNNKNKNILNKNKDNNKNKPIKNTENFDPINNDIADLRLNYINANNRIQEKFSHKLIDKDIIIINNLFSDFKQDEIYDKLMNEINNCGIDETKLLKLWHGNDIIPGTHLIVDDKQDWKCKCPTFNLVINRIKEYFNMKVQSTRFNIFTDTHQYKSLHFDASKIKPHIAKKQNFTIAISFGATREVVLERDTKNRTKICFPIGDGSIYGFTHFINCTWRHGILQDKIKIDKGRISIIAWGWIDF